MCNVFWTAYLGLSVTTVDPTDSTETYGYKALNKIAFVLGEDAPQVLLQTINTLYIGQTLTWF
jgi:hypothetical protein